MASAPQTNFDRAAAEYVRTRANRPPKITQIELGQRAGIPPATIGRYWRGDVSMTLGSLKKICDVFGVDLTEALEEIGRIELSLNKADRE